MREKGEVMVVIFMGRRGTPDEKLVRRRVQLTPGVVQPAHAVLQQVRRACTYVLSVARCVCDVLFCFVLFVCLFVVTRSGGGGGGVEGKAY